MSTTVSMQSGTAGQGSASQYGKPPNSMRSGTFPHEYIAAEENVIYETKPSILAFIRPIRFAIAIALFVILGSSARWVPAAVYVLLFLFVVIPMIGLALGLLRWWATSYAITDKRALMSVGIISRDSVDCAHDKIQQATLRQGILDRLFGFGNIVFQTAGVTVSPRKRRAFISAGGVYWRGVKDPVNTRRFVQEVIELSKRQQKIREFEDMAAVLRQSGTPMTSQGAGANVPAAARMPSSAAVAAPGPGESVGAGWVERLQANVQELERALAQQKAVLLSLDEGLIGGRIENATYQQISRTRSTEIADLQKLLEERKAELARAQGKAP